MRCLYGKQDMYKDVTDIVKEHFVKDNDIVIPQNTAFNDLFGDIIPNEVKALYIEIGDKKMLITEDDIRKHTYKIDGISGEVGIASENKMNLNDNRVLFFENNQLVMKDESHLIGTKFEDIPAEFRTKFEEYWKKRISNITKLENGNYELEGIEFPNNIRSEHQKLDIFSETYMNYMTEEFYLAHLWHEFAEENDILYSICHGNLLGYYRNNDHILWDDDFDIIMREKDFNIVEEIWNNSEKKYKYPIQGWDIYCWQYINIKIKNVDLILIKFSNEYGKYPYDWGPWYKFKLNNRISIYNVDIGGIDIFMCTKINGEYRATLEASKDCFDFPKNDSLISDFPIKEYGPIKLKIVKKTIGIRCLNGRYTNNWTIKKHPGLLVSDLKPSYKI